MSGTKKIILFDCDVISHFISNNCLDDLPLILAPHQCTILDYVYNEVAFHPFRIAFVNKLIKDEKLLHMNFPNNNMDIKREFARIKQSNHLIGDGERACMAVAKFHKDIIASSNFRDVAPYCERHKIYYLGTIDILSIAVEKGIYNESKCDNFIQNAVKFNKAKFPNGVTQMRYYIPRDLSFL
ncbi:MAG: hypothetical protein GX242_06670 [Clostridiales bacterium]|nr:hypothetical protein [Clostridiales bacterium]